MRGIAWLCVAVAAASSVPSAAGAASAPRDPSSAREALFRRQTEIGNLENALAVNRTDIANMVAQARFFPIERRLLDADLFFETGDYEKSSTLYRDLVDNPSFAAMPGYWRAVFKLGESLFRQRNHLAARAYFRKAANPAAGQDFALAVARLFEVAVATRDFADCERYEALMPGLYSSPDAAYSYGKYLYFRDRKGEAREAFARVAPGTPPYARAQYFIGVIEATGGRLEPSLTFFETAIRTAPAPTPEGDVRGAAQVARARILHELGRFSDAVVALQEVDAKSPSFLESLFDAAWIYLKMDELEKAAHALDILLMSSPPGELALKANALRGRILSRLNDSDGAVEAYQEVSSTLGPVTAELEKVAADSRTLDAYFEWVIERNSRTFKIEVPISERTAKWVESDPGMAAIVGMFQDISKERDDVRESFEIVERLLWALRSGGKLEAFPGLKDKFLKLKEVEGRFLDAGSGSGDDAAQVLSGRLQGDARTRYDAAVRAREAAMARLRNAPRTLQQYKDREKVAGEDYRELEKQLFLVESLLRVERQQVIAIEDWLREQNFREGGTPLSAEREVEIRASVEGVKAMLASFADEATRIRAALERDRVTNAAIADAIRSEDAARREAVRALQAEAEACKAAAGAVDPAAAEVARSAAALMSKAAAGVAAIDPVTANLMEVADRGAADYEAAVGRERARLESSLTEVQKAELDSRAFARTEGAVIFRGVKDRLADVLLEADLGLVDMAWQREQQVSEKLRAMGIEKSEKLKRVNDMEQMIKADAGTGAGEGSAQ
ncbi:MAG: tetratricopeptide repeat protein [Deltaproteobacteria bacterium]|nr:tetratricopeptide repeat protein [Deltaproteobacteria bacterium]